MWKDDPEDSLAERNMTEPISTAGAPRYTWGDVCEGWHLVQSEGLSVIQERMPAGTQERRHIHKYARQFFFVLQGQLTIEVDGRTYGLGTHSGVEVPPGSPHQVFNHGPDELIFLVISQPPGQQDRVPAEILGKELAIQPVSTEAELEQVRSLFLEYWDSFGFTPCFQNFADEVATLPGRYAPPGGRLALALYNGQPAGCMAFRRVEERTCEAKRLFVRTAFRGLGVGRALLEWVAAAAREAGYRTMVADTLPVMGVALAMYERAGFKRSHPPDADPVGETIYLKLEL